jgi:hypothetical protein
MEHASPEQLRDWVVEQTACLEPPPGWRPDPSSALTRFHARMQMDRARPVWKRWQSLIAAAALAVATLALMPATRAVAQEALARSDAKVGAYFQRLWQYLTVPKVAFIRVNPWPEGVPSPRVSLIGVPIPPIPARDVEEARWRVHFDPRLPHPGVLSTSPRLSTTFSLSAGTVVRVAELELALRKAGVADQTVPPEWDGAQLALHTSAIVIAEWPDIVLTQSLPLTLTAPPGFDFAAYSAFVLRIVGVDPDTAQRLAQRAGTTPPWLAPIAQNFDETTQLEEINLNSGQAMLLQETGYKGAASRITIVWSVPDRVYALRGNVTRELAISTANAVQ